MERSSSRLHSGTLSQAAQKILAVLRAQSRHAGKSNQSVAYNHRQMVEKYCGSQGELVAQNRWSMSQEGNRAKDVDRSWSTLQVSAFSTSHHDSSSWWQSSQPSACYQSLHTADWFSSSQASSSWDPQLQRKASEAHYQPLHIYSQHPELHVYQSGRSLSFIQYESSEMAPSFLEGCTLHPQIPERVFGPWGNSTGETRSSFIHIHPQDNELGDEVLFPASERSNTQDNGPFSTCHPVSSCLKISKETDDNSSGAQIENEVIESCNISRNEIKDSVGTDSQAKKKCVVPLTEATCGREDGGKLHQQRESETIKSGGIHLIQSSSFKKQESSFDASKLISLREKVMQVIVQSEKMIEVSTGQLSNRQHDEKGPINEEKWNDSACRETRTKRKREERNLLLELNVNTISEKKSVVNKICCSYTGGDQSLEKDSDNTRKIQEVEHQPCSVNEETSVKRLAGSKTKSSQDEDQLKARLEETGRSEEAHTCMVHKTDMDLQTQCETDHHNKISESRAKDAELRESADGDVSVMPPVDSNESTSTEGCGRESGSTPTASQGCNARRSRFTVPYLPQQMSNGNIRSNSNLILASTCTFPTQQNSSSAQKVENINWSTSLTHSHHLPWIPPSSVKRKHEILEHQNAHPPPKISLTQQPPKWEPPPFSQKRAKQSTRNKLTRARPKPQNIKLFGFLTESQTNISETSEILEAYTDQDAPKQNQRFWQRKLAKNASEEISSSVTCQSPSNIEAKIVSDKGIKCPITLHGDPDGSKTQNQSKPSNHTTSLTSDRRVKDCGMLSPEEQKEILEKAKEAKALVLTLVYRDGTTQLDPEQKLTPAACGLLMLMKNRLDFSPAEDSLGPNDSLIYLKLERTPAWAQQSTYQSPEMFTRDMLLQVLSRSQLVVCFKAKDLLRTALEFYRKDLGWKQNVAGCCIHDPQVSGWLLDPTNPSSCYQDLLNKHLKIPQATPALGVKKVSQVISGLSLLYWLNLELDSKLQSQGLWKLYSDMELKMISVLAVMESHHIHVDKDTLKRTSDLLGTKMKQLEQEAHQAAGQIFLVSSNTQLRAVLFDKLCLHEQCKNKKLPKTLNKQQQSTSEAALLQLQDLHPLPKIILEYRQVHKLKSTFVDGILSCMMNKDYISSKWYQTSAVTGRITAKHPNFQALPRQPLKITKKQHIQDIVDHVLMYGYRENLGGPVLAPTGKEEEVVSVHPRAMFVPQNGWTFLSADFCQVELRLLAHLSSDPELLRIFTQPHTDVFTMLASQWKGLRECEVTSEDREHAKRIVYSVVYGAGRERLSGILGVSMEQASQFQDSFLQTYKEVQAFIHRTIQQCHKQGYVLSIMGRRRTLPYINSPDWSVRMQAERQAVNFVVQGSAADLCKMAMIRIFSLVASSSLSVRLIAQLHDELLYEVEDFQVEQFAALVRSTMESLQHIDHLGVHLKVPLRVAVSRGKSWGSMSELNIPPTFPCPH